jgi:hypothetical protein
VRVLRGEISRAVRLGYLYHPTQAILNKAFRKIILPFHMLSQRTQDAFIIPTADHFQSYDFSVPFLLSFMDREILDSNVHFNSTKMINYVMCT